ncbi:hypothetical protein [Neobacillus sp.]|uniref:hypothetical protein n=1 Tax=Neobacillus sp. TaxID=2675273 RepID=UPI00289C43FF|nr:hypothetical protein [Neobacillus sp.]
MIINCAKILLTMKIILTISLKRKVLHMAYAFVGGTIIVYAFVMKHVLKNVTQQ